MDKEDIVNEFRARFLKYTEKAFSALPKRKFIHILDLGCGTGIVTIKLAKLSNSPILAIDINQKALEKFQNRMNLEPLNNQITLSKTSLSDLNFPENSFDLIWAEGVLHIIGFKKGFKLCSNLMKNGGYLVLNEAVKGIDKDLKYLKQFGLKLYKKIKLPDKLWITEYYEPLEVKLNNMPKKNNSNVSSRIIKELNNEIEQVKKMNPRDLKCAFYIIKKQK